MIGSPAFTVSRRWLRGEAGDNDDIAAAACDSDEAEDDDGADDADDASSRSDADSASGQTGDAVEKKLVAGTLAW